MKTLLWPQKPEKIRQVLWQSPRCEFTFKINKQNPKPKPPQAVRGLNDSMCQLRTRGHSSRH